MIKGNLSKTGLTEVNWPRSDFPHDCETSIFAKICFQFECCVVMSFDWYQYYNPASEPAQDFTSCAAAFSFQFECVVQCR